MERVEGVLSLLDVMYQFPPGYMGQVVDEALQYRDQVSQGSRDSLNAAINNSGIRLDGFRDVSKADADTLSEPVFGELLDGNERLLRSVWRTWMESKEPLRAQVEEVLGRLGISTEGIQGKGEEGIAVWEEEDWVAKVGTIQAEVGDADELDVRLMMTCVSGMAPDLPEDDEPIRSEMFIRWLETLREMPADAEDWGDLDVFVRELGAIAYEKGVERALEQIDRLEAYIRESQSKFADELEFLEIDLSGWIDDAIVHPPYGGRFLQVAEALHYGLVDYVKLKPTGKTRREELERRVKRDDVEGDILAFVEEWQELADAARTKQKEIEEALTEEEGADGDDDKAEDVKAEEHTSESSAELEEEAVAEAAALSEELERERRKRGRLEEDKAALESERRGLEVKAADLEGEVDRLRQELYESQQAEKAWREQFVSVSKSAAADKVEEAEEVGDVGDAIERARRAFPKQLVVALNSKSDVETPFKRPEEVYSVLAWLGTEYHRARTREFGRDPQFDKLLKEACSGWFYKPKQTDETKDQFPEWYRTRVGDREYELDMHVGKGTSFDPQNTIRIAFDWDDEGKRVVVGYIGRHQKNRRS